MQPSLIYCYLKCSQVEEVLDLPEEGLRLGLVAEQLELGDGVARPAVGLALAIALQEEAQRLLVAVVGQRLARHHHDLPG